MAHFPAFRSLINDMQVKEIDIEHFQVTYARVIFDVIISLDVQPHEILIGGRGINWACILEISDDLEIIMPDRDFYALLNVLELQENGIERFGSYIFLRYINQSMHRDFVQERQYNPRLCNVGTQIELMILTLNREQYFIDGLIKIKVVIEHIILTKQKLTLGER